MRGMADIRVFLRKLGFLHRVAGLFCKAARLRFIAAAVERAATQVQCHSNHAIAAWRLPVSISAFFTILGIYPR